jgi:hypothetical protein
MVVKAKPNTDTQTNDKKTTNKQTNNQQNNRPNTPQESSQQTKTPQKYIGRLVLVTGDKGGTGKSVMARLLLDIYRHRNIDCIAYECDQSNPQLFRHYKNIPPGVKTLKLNQRGGADALQDDLERFSPKVSLVDLPAGAAEYFESVASDIHLFKNAEIMGYRITMVSVLGRVKDSVVQLKRLVDFCSDRVDYVVAKNLYWGEDKKFIRYNDSKVRQVILNELGAVELLLPDLYDNLFDFIDSQDLTFREALEHDGLTVSNRSRIFDWVDKAETQLETAAWMLGLDI